MDKTTKLLQLKKMLDDRLISESEFQQMKTELLQDDSKPPKRSTKPIITTFISGFFSLQKQSKWLLPVLLIAILAVSFGVIFLSDETKPDNVSNQVINNNDSIFPNNSYSSNEEFSVPQKMTYSFFSNNFNNDHLFLDDFYPIGWSPDGKFAFITGHQRCDNDGNYFRFSIQDMVSDKTLVSEEYYGTESTIQPVWSKLKTKITQKLIANKIMQTSVQLNALPYFQMGNSYDFHLYSRESTESDIPSIGASTIHLKINGDLKKKIYGKNYGYAGPVQSKVIGCIRSPFENRVIAVLANEYPCFENQDGEVSLCLIGCFLD